ncbi:putative OsmC-like protein [Neorhizobium galegae]|uniref:OsmC family protein n=1 Tax=Neorhizobium galegae TaxID=399 RepID=UPI001AE6E31A|nr:OsmC family protein [Neorhizobium galegae]MBP2562420.1 putative OsmC-like protein [Neorhizobium galegae]
MLDYRIAARRINAEGSVANARTAEIQLESGLSGSPDAFNPAELLLAAIGYRLVKRIEHVTPMLDFKLGGVEVSPDAVRQENPPRIISIDYGLVVDSNESDRRLELRHKNVLKYGMISNTVAAATHLDGTIKRKS